MTWEIVLLVALVSMLVAYHRFWANYEKKPFEDGTHNREPKLELEYKEYNRLISTNTSLFYALIGISIPLFLSSSTKAFGLVFLVASALPFYWSRRYELESSRRFYWLRDWEIRRLPLQQRKAIMQDSQRKIPVLEKLLFWKKRKENPTEQETKKEEPKKDTEQKTETEEK